MEQRLTKKMETFLNILIHHKKLTKTAVSIVCQKLFQEQINMANRLNLSQQTILSIHQTINQMYHQQILLIDIKYRAYCTLLMRNYNLMSHIVCQLEHNLHEKEQKLKILIHDDLMNQIKINTPTQRMSTFFLLSKNQMTQDGYTYPTHARKYLDRPLSYLVNLVYDCNANCTSRMNVDNSNNSNHSYVVGNGINGYENVSSLQQRPVIETSALPNFSNGNIDPLPSLIQVPRLAHKTVNVRTKQLKVNNSRVNEKEKQMNGLYNQNKIINWVVRGNVSHNHDSHHQCELDYFVNIGKTQIKYVTDK